MNGRLTGGGLGKPNRRATTPCPKWNAGRFKRGSQKNFQQPLLKYEQTNPPPRHRLRRCHPQPPDRRQKPFRRPRRLASFIASCYAIAIARRKLKNLNAILIKAPMARFISAKGNALGKPNPPTQALTGRFNEPHVLAHCCPARASFYAEPKNFSTARAIVSSWPASRIK